MRDMDTALAAAIVCKAQETAGRLSGGSPPHVEIHFEAWSGDPHRMWLAAVPVKPARHRDRYCRAFGMSPSSALTALARQVGVDFSSVHRLRSAD